VLIIALSIVLTFAAAQCTRRYFRGRLVRARVEQSRPARQLRSVATRCPTLRTGRRAQPVDDLPRFIDDISRRCSSGDSLSAAFVGASQQTWCAQLFASALQSLTNGSTLTEALHNPPTIRHDDVLLTWHVLKLCALHGGILNEPLDRAAATLRGRQAISHERAAQSAQARLSAKVLTIAPVAFAGWTALTTAAVRDFFASPAGLICVSAGALVNLTGWAWMNRIVSSTA
jgi:Flp pilus assembly protein TadB